MKSNFCRKTFLALVVTVTMLVTAYLGYVHIMGKRNAIKTIRSSNNQCISSAVAIDLASAKQHPSVRSMSQNLLNYQRKKFPDVNPQDIEVELNGGLVADLNCDKELEAVLLFFTRVIKAIGDAHIVSFSLPSWAPKARVDIDAMWEGELSYVDLTGDNIPELIVKGLEDPVTGGNHPAELLYVISTSEFQIIGEFDVKFGDRKIELQDLNQNGVPEIITVSGLLGERGPEDFIPFADAFRGKPKVFEWDPQQRKFAEYTPSHAFLVNSAIQSIADLYRKVNPRQYPLAFELLEREYGSAVINEALQTFSKVEEHRPQIRNALLSSNKSLAEAMDEVGNILGINDQEVIYSIVSTVMADEFVVNPAGEIKRFRDVEYSVLRDIARREFKNTKPSPLVSVMVEILADYKGIPLTDEEKYFISVAITYAGKQVLLASADNVQTKSGRVVYLKQLPDGSVLYIPTLTETEQQQIADLITAAYQAYRDGASVEFATKLFSKTMQKIDVSSLDMNQAEEALQEIDKIMKGFAGSKLLKDIAQSLDLPVPDTFRRSIDNLFDWP